MRSTRLRRFRKKYQPLIISFKMVLVLYMVLFSVSFLTSDTVAYFKGENVSNFTISAGTWEEKIEADEEKEEELEEDEKEEAEREDTSALAFVDQEVVDNQTCPAQIEVEIENEGEGPMLTEGFYEVYYIETGDPKEDGEQLTLNEDEGTIEILESEQTTKLIYETSTPGFYQFVIHHDEDTPEEDRIWSDVIEVICEDEEIEVEEKESASEEIITDQEAVEEEPLEENEEVGEDINQISNGAEDEAVDDTAGEKGEVRDEENENNEVDK